MTTITLDTNKKKAVVNNKKATWVLTREDIDRSYDIAMEEFKKGTLITL